MKSKAELRSDKFIYKSVSFWIVVEEVSEDLVAVSGHHLGQLVHAAHHLQHRVQHVYSVVQNQCSLRNL